MKTKLKKTLQGLVGELTNYSERWKWYLLYMTEIKERIRPDFTLLHRILMGEIRSFEFDDRIPLQYAQTDQRLSVSVTYGRDAVRKGDDLIPCMIEVCANLHCRPGPMDIVCLVDLSGSIENSTSLIQLQVLKELISRLGKQDRLSLVGFTDEYENTTHKLTTSRNSLLEFIERKMKWEEDGCTNLFEAFKTALSIINMRRVCNNQVTILILSDGNDNFSGADYERYRDLIEQTGLPIQVHCLCLGQHINTPLLNPLAHNHSGHSCTLHSPTDIKPTLTTLFPMLRPTVFTDIRITLNQKETRIPCETAEFNSETQIWNFGVFSMVEGETKQFIFRIRPKWNEVPTVPLPLTISPLTVTVSYKITGLAPPVESYSPSINFQPATEPAPAKVYCVYVGLYCAKAVYAIDSALKMHTMGDTENARSIINRAMELIGGCELYREIDEDQRTVSGIPSQVPPEEQEIQQYASLHPKLFDALRSLLQTRNRLI